MYISIDLGRSTTRIASTLDLKSIYKIVKFRTESDIHLQRNSMFRAFEEVSGGTEVDAVAFGFPGITDKFKKVFEKSANYPQIEGLDIKNFFPEKFKQSQILVENDAALGALGEAYFGSGENNDSVAYLTLSTGLGGAFVKKYENEYLLVNAEPGHQIINIDDSISDNTGIKGTFESYCAGSSFRKRFNAIPDVTAGENIWKKYSYYLSAGIINIVSMWNPEVIVLGGGLSIHNFDNFYKHLVNELKKQSFFAIPDIRKSVLGDDSGVYGGFILLKENL
jgi:glucokinase